MVSKYIVGYLFISTSPQEVKAMRTGLVWEVYLSPIAIATSEPGFWPRTMSGSMALLPPLSVLISIAPVTTEVCEDA